MANVSRPRHQGGRLEKSLINAASGIISQLLVIFINFASRTIFIRCLPSEYLGINGLFANVLTILSFAELGIGEAMVFAMYRPMRADDSEQLCKLVNFYKYCYRVIALVVALTGIVISFNVDSLFKDAPRIRENLQLIFLLYVANSVASYLLTYRKSVLLVAQKRWVINGITVLFAFVQLLGQFIVLAVLNSYLLYLVVLITCTFISNIASNAYVRLHYPDLNDPKPRLDKADRDQILGNVRALAVTKFAGIVGTGTDNIIASKLIGITVVGYASNYTLIVNAINSLLWSLLNGLTNSIGDFNVDSTTERRREIFDQLYLSAFLLFTFVCCCLVCMINPFIELWIGEEYLIDIGVPFALALSVFVGGVNYPAYSYRVSLGIFNEVSFFYIGYALLNVLLSIWWGNVYGITGVFIATPVSRLVTAEIGDGYYVYSRALHRNPLRYYLREGLAIAYFAVLTLFIFLVISQIGISGIYGFVLKLIVCVVLVTLILILSVFKLRQYRALMARFRRHSRSITENDE